MACRGETRTVQQRHAQQGGRNDAGSRARHPAFLEAVGVSRSFGPVEVLSDVSVAFRRGEVHAIIGENGAGKSTLMRILSGHLAPSRGAIRLDGAPLALRGPVDAERRGIVLVHQEIMLAPDLSIAENMFLGRELRRGVAVDDRTMNARAEEAMRAFGVDVSVTVPVQRLSIARRQLAQIRARWVRRTASPSSMSRRPRSRRSKPARCSSSSANSRRRGSRSSISRIASRR